MTNNPIIAALEAERTRLTSQANAITSAIGALRQIEAFKPNGQAKANGRPGTPGAYWAKLSPAGRRAVIQKRLATIAARRLQAASFQGAGTTTTNEEATQ